MVVIFRSFFLVSTRMERMLPTVPTASKIGEPTFHTSCSRRNSGKELTGVLLWFSIVGKGSWRRGGSCVKRVISVEDHVRRNSTERMSTSTALKHALIIQQLPPLQRLLRPLPSAVVTAAAVTLFDPTSTIFMKCQSWTKLSTQCRSFHFTFRSVFRNTWNLSDFIYHCKSICFSRGRLANFRFNIYFYIQRFGLCSRKIYQISLFCFALKYTPKMGLTDIGKLKYRYLNLFHPSFAVVRFVSLCCHVNWGSAWVTVKCIETGKKKKKTWNFPGAEPKPLR